MMFKVLSVSLLKTPVNKAYINLPFLKPVCGLRGYSAAAHQCPLSREFQPFKPLQMVNRGSLFRASIFFHHNVYVDCD